MSKQKKRSKSTSKGGASDRNGVGPSSFDDQTVQLGAGGETHQRAGEGRPVLTTQQGVRVADDQNSLKYGARGPTLLEDFHFREKIFHFDHERIPECVGNNIPVFFIHDAMKFPDLIHAAKQEPDRGFPQAQTAHDNFWDFISLMPESMHMVTWIMSDRAIPRSFRFMEGFGVHSG